MTILLISTGTYYEVGDFSSGDFGYNNKQCGCFHCPFMLTNFLRREVFHVDNTYLFFGT